MSEQKFEQEPLTGFSEMVEPITVLEIGCGVRYDGSPNDKKTGRMYDLPYIYHGIEREEEFAHSTRRIRTQDEGEIEKARDNARESGIIFGNAADLPFEDDSIDVVTLRSVFGQFRDKDYREFDNVIRFGLMEAFRVLKPGGIIAISEENTPWDEDNVFHYLNNVGFTVVDYAAMQKAQRAPDRVNFMGRAIGDYKNRYAPENEEWFKKLTQFYGEEFGGGFLSTPRQYLMVAQKQQPATIEETHEWGEWSVAEDIFDTRDSECTQRQKTYRRGQPVEQDFLPGMYRRDSHNKRQEKLFYMPTKSFFS